jgi:hypothetical protein
MAGMRRLAGAEWRYERWLLALTLLFAAGAIVLGIACGSPPPHHKGGDPRTAIVMAAICLPFAGVGAAVVARRPENSIGWLFAVVGLLFAISAFGTGWVAYSVFKSPLPGASVAAWIIEWLVPMPLFVGPLLLLLLFPDGRPLTPRWRLALAGVALLAILVPTASLQQGQFSDWPQLSNPVGFSGAVGRAVGSIDTKLGLLAVPVFLAAGTCLVLRLRRSHGQERLQIKWVVYAASLAAAGFTIAFMTPSPISDVIFWFGLVGLASTPFAAGLAILRYRLYEIDRLINRTLVYGLLTAALGALYVGSVLLLQLALEGVTSDSSLAVAISTLAVAAAFRPARGRIQGVVDRRFYRRRYDAAQTLDAFSARLREEVDLDSLAAELAWAVSETMEPRHVSLWLRQP